MVGLGSKTPNTLTSYQSNAAIKKSNVKKKSFAEAQAASSTGNIVAPEITTDADTKDESDRQNTSRLVSIGLKEAIVAAIKSIVGAQITNPILCTTDGSDFRRVDEYNLNQLLRSVKGGSEWLSATAIRNMIVDVMATSFYWR